MPTGNVKDKIDRDLLHEYLWKISETRSHKLTIRQDALAEGLGITPFTMAKIFRELLDDGKLRRMRKTFFVVDPAVSRWGAPRD